MIYVLLLIFCTFCGFLISHTNKRDKKIVFIILLFSLVSISALRYNVGKDFFDYYNFYMNIDNLKSMNYEIGFYLINKVLHVIFKNPQFFFLFTSLIINFFVCKSIMSSKGSKAMGLYIYICGTFFFFSLNGVRQSIAIALFYYSLYFLKNNNFIKYFFINMIGALFHTSALVFLPLYFLLKKKINTKLKIIIILSTYFFSFVASKYIILLLSSTKYNFYLSKAGYFTLGSFNISSIINLILFLLYEFLITKKDKEDIIYSNIHFFGIIVSIFLPILPLVNRFFVSFKYIEVLSVPNLMEKIKYGRFAKIIVYSLYFLYFYNSLFNGNSNSVLPYISIFNK